MPVLHMSDVRPSPAPLLLRADDANAARSVRRGRLVRVARGVYSFADAWSALAPWERYLTRVHAVALSHPDAIFVHESGCALRGLPVFGEPHDVHILQPSPATSRRLKGIRVHTSTRMPRHELMGGIRVATPDELAAETAPARRNPRHESRSRREMAVSASERPCWTGRDPLGRIGRA